MNSKAFVLLLVTVLVLGAGLGGAFAGGLALGKSQDDEGIPSTVVPSASSVAPGDQEAAGQPDQIDQPDLSDLRQRFQSGEITQEELAELREQFQGQAGGFGGGQGFGGAGGQRFGGAGGQGFGGGGGLVGTVESLDGNMLTVNTPQGPLLAALGEETLIQMFAEGSLSDLSVGTRVTVTGQRGEDGSVEAVSILIIPEGAGGFPAGGFGSG